jgi:predicted methyltransferase
MTLIRDEKSSLIYNHADLDLFFIGLGASPLNPRNLAGFVYVRRVNSSSVKLTGLQKILFEYFLNHLRQDFSVHQARKLLKLRPQ